jgi:glycosyltransferase involved in cell wall biosynthesis
MAAKPIVILSSYPPRLCGIGTFAEEAREFIQKANPDRPVLVVTFTDGAGEGVLPVMDIRRRDWWKAGARTIEELKPYAVHIQHEYGLYNYIDERGESDFNHGFLDLLDAINEHPVVVEPHTVHGRLTDFEANFLYEVCHLAHVVLLKCHYQKWRLEWTFPGRGWDLPRNILVVPHGARPDRRWKIEEVPALRAELGLDRTADLAPHLVGLIGWIQSNKRWDILTSMWEDLAAEIRRRTGQDWDLLAAGTMRDPNDLKKYEQWKGEVQLLERKGIARYFEFVPRGDVYYKVMAVCDFVVLPTIDETQSGTLARIISLNKPYITTAPLEGLTAQTLESEGGLLFTTKEMLRRQVLRLACDEGLRFRLGGNLKRYLEKIASWEVVAQQYNYAYRLARRAAIHGEAIEIPREF